MKKYYCIFFLIFTFYHPALSQSCERVCNSDFENAILATPGNLAFVTSFEMDCWNTTAFDGVMEVWSDGFEGVPAYSGQQFIELNANVVSTLYQDISVVPGETFSISFAHRGRWGVDILSLSVGPIGGPYVNLGNFTADQSTWTYNSVAYTFPDNGVSNYSLRFNSVSSSGGSPSVGNFLDAISVTSANVLSLNLVANNIACTPDLTLGSINAQVAGSIGGVTYAWTPNVSSTGSASNLSAGTYELIVTDSLGCADTAQVTILGQLPTINVSPDVVACNGTSVQLTATGNGQITWTNGITDGVDFVPPVGVTHYIATNTLTNGCQLSDTVKTTIYPDPVPLFSSNIREGCESLSVLFTNETANTQSCVWDFGNGESSIATDSEAVTYVNDGTYSVALTVTDLHGCEGTSQLSDYILVFPSPLAAFSTSSDYFGFDVTNIEFTNESVGATAFAWKLGEFATSNAANPEFNLGGIEENITVQLAVSNQFGCKDSTVKSLVYQNIETFYIPNTFTPDGNHFNNTFVPVFSPGFQMTFYRLRVYNRWGQVLFESNDPKTNWDGTFQNQEIPDGTYTWELVLHDQKEAKKKFTGHLNLMR